MRLRTVVLTITAFLLATVAALLASPGAAMAGYTWSN
ncbi:hypothetical protein C8E87_6049 [Paractinoplanes brasiliensis]|uniref:Uncharacterized protein n=1 Tax=Paractinoplanes brasiliensis TaxID=52695 RepID=A0A4R6K1V3_9ACTN|nr:hypothetical protein C8E87_6049 [Actinoplanes brasiliensis]